MEGMVIPKHTGKPVGTPASLNVWSRRIRLQRHRSMRSVYRAVCYYLCYWAINKFYEVFSKDSAIVQSSFFSIPHTMWSSHLQKQTSIFFLAAAALAKLFYFFPSFFFQHMLRLHAGCISIHFTATKFSTHIFPSMSLLYYYIKAGY